MVEQKGFDLLSAAAPQLLSLDATFVLLGTGDPSYEAEWNAYAKAAPRRVGVRIAFDERLAHLIEGGADIFLMPSRFEPCGLNQMYSLRYGTVPVVRATGGLDDTVENYSTRTGRGTGFKFKGYTGGVLLRAVRSALQLYGDRKRWRGVQLAGMAQDHSWGGSARKYVRVYERARTPDAARASDAGETQD
jgi:starch synthase